jgi:hypothetical protein
LQMITDLIARQPTDDPIDRMRMTASLGRATK